MLKRIRLCVVLATVAAVPFVTGCTVGGAAAGGYVGHETTHSTVGTVGGAVAGGVIGHELSK
jgi:osmotically inducible lipoprotein OsmB